MTDELLAANEKLFLLNQKLMVENRKLREALEVAKHALITGTSEGGVFWRENAIQAIKALEVKK